jgi:Domain of unknown function (DUF4920)
MLYKGTKLILPAQYHKVVIFFTGGAVFTCIFANFGQNFYMKHILLAIAVLVSVSVAAQIKPAAKGVTYGAKTTKKGAVEVAVLKQQLDETSSFTGKVKGKITSVCEKKGCWMKLKQENGEDIRITFKDYGFFMPQDIVGKKVVLDGVAKMTVTSVADLQHYAEDAGKSKEEIAKITQPKKEVEFIAKGVLVL